MKNSVGLLIGVLGLICIPVSTLAQEKSFNGKVKDIAVSLKKNTTTEKELLKIKVDSLNVLVENNKLTEVHAQKLKEQFAAETSKRIELNANVYNDSLTNLVQNQVQQALKYTSLKTDELENDSNTSSFQIEGGKNSGAYRSDNGYKKEVNKLGEKRTSFRMGGLFGMANLTTDGEFGEAGLKNNMFTMFNGGFYLKTRLLKDNNALYLRYGIVGEIVSLKPKYNNYYTIENGQTVIAQHEKDLGKSRLSIPSMQFPISFEYDFSKKGVDEKTGRTYFRSEDSWRIGLGGYVSLFNRNQSKQVYHYTEAGTKYRIERKEDLGIAKTRFGLMTYVGYKAFALQFGYELTPMFKHNEVKQNMWSLGLRLDL